MLKTKLDTLEGVHESLLDMYEKQEDGTFTLKAPEGYVAADSVEDVGGLKSALQKERDSGKATSRENKALKDKLSGIDTDKYKELLDAESNAETTALEKKGEWDKIKEQMTTAQASALKEKDAEIARLKGQLEHVQVDSKVVEAITKADGNVELLRRIVRDRVQLNTDDFSLVILDSDGKTPKVDGDGNPVTLDALVGEMRTNDTYSGAFKATEQSGSGSGPQHSGDGPSGSGGGKPNGEGKSRSQMSEREKVDFQKAHGIDKFMDLPA